MSRHSRTGKLDEVPTSVDVLIDESLCDCGVDSVSPLECAETHIADIKTAWHTAPLRIEERRALILAFGLDLTDGWQNQVIFPLNLNALNSPEFVDYEVPFYNGQQANKEVYVPAANAYTGMTYTPFGQYYYDAFTEQLAAINEGSVSGSEAADRLQEDVVAYAEEQGFTVE